MSAPTRLSRPTGVPSLLAGRLAELLHARHADALFPAVLAMVAPFIAPEARRGDERGAVVTDVRLVQQLTRTLTRYHAHELLLEILDAVEPYLPVLPPTDTVRVAGRSVPTGESLTEREREVLAGMALGKSNGEIGRGLRLSEDTIKTHARRLFRKLGARDRAHAVSIGYRRGFLLVDPDIRRSA